jgi:hypothetical protein
MLLFIMLSPVVSACDPSVTFSIQNQTNQHLTIYIHDKNLANVTPYSEVEIKGIPRIFNHYPIEARNAQGAVIFSRRFTEQELDDMDWIIVIPPLQSE